MSQIWAKITLIFLLILVYETTTCNALRHIQFRSVKSRWSPHYFSNFSTYLVNNSMYLDMNSIKVLHNGYKGHVEFQIRLKGSKSYQTLFDYTLDICNMVVSLKDTLFKRWFQSFLKYGNFMQNCPVHKGHYYLNGWKLDKDLMPAYLYAGDYRVKGYGFYGKYGSKSEEFVGSIEWDVSLMA